MLWQIRRGFIIGRAALDGVAGGGALSWSTTYSQTFTADNSGWNGYNVRQLILSANLSSNGSHVRATLAASLAAGGFVIDFAEIGHAAASGDPYDFDGGQVPLTFSGGSAGCTVAQGATILSDAMTFNLDKTKNLIVAAHFSGASSFRSANVSLSISMFYKSGANEVSVANVSGYGSQTGIASLVSLIEVSP